MKNTLLFSLILLLSWSLQAQQTTSLLKGTVTTKGEPVPGALIRIAGTNTVTLANEEGNFEMPLPDGNHNLEVSYIGMNTLKLEITMPYPHILEVSISGEGISLREFEVLSTGYQEIPRERATGSFVQVERELVDRRISTNILDRLEDITPGLVFNRSQSARDPISIRGRNTIFANARPLIVVDNFPYDGPLESINPNDVESITVLRDAAAASIWGSQSGNGVIVITTKSGATKGKIDISFNSNMTFSERPDLLYVPRMDVGEFIEIERELFGRNFYNSQERNLNRPVLSPAVETFIQVRDGLISADEGENRIMQYKNSDLRRDIMDNYHRTALFKQNSLNISGNSGSHRYFLGFGYDDNAAPVIGNSNNRFTLTLKDTWTNANGKLEFSNAVFLTTSNNRSTTSLPQGNAYASLRDEHGNPIELDRNLSRRFKASVADQGLLDWAFIPLNEIGMNDNHTANTDWRINSNLSYNIADGLKASVLYQYWNNTGSTRDRSPVESYHTRDMINMFTQRDADGNLFRPIPVGDILETSSRSAYSHHLRTQLTYSKSFGQDHRLNAIGGWEIKNLEGISSSSIFYGYRDDLGLSSPVDFVTQWPRFQNPGQRATIRSGIGHTGNIDRFISYFMNAGYSFKNRYDLTLSARKDQSNLFGVATNQRGVPLWSAGMGWTISQENFASASNFPYMKIRTTFGYNGNVDRSLTSDITARYQNSLNFSFIPALPIATITNPPNPDLRWERIKVLNLALDFETSNGLFAGSLEWYNKEGIDLIGSFPVPAYTGMTTFRGNFANTLARGFDFNISANVGKSDFRWRPNFFWSHVKERVTNYEAPTLTSLLINSLNTPEPLPMVDKPLFSVFSYPWGGLNPDNGNPRGFLDGELSESYFQIMNNTAPEDLIFHGSARPTHFGALRNDFFYRGFSVSVNVAYRMGYYYRRNSINYFTLLRGEIGHGDYHDRWQNPGDEAHTQIPSRPATADLNRNNFFTSSAALVEKGDHIRLQDIRLSYAIDKTRLNFLPFKRLEIYAYANNLAMIWKASDDPLDPDFRTARPLRTLALGLRADF